MIIGIDARMYGAEQTTGIGQYIKQLTNNLFNIDQENQYVLFLKEPAYSDFKCPNEQIKKVEVSSHWYTYQEQFKLPFELSKNKIDLIHFPHFNSPIVFFKPSVCTIHDLTPFYFPGHKMKSKFRQWGYNTVFKSTVSKAKQIIAVSKSTKTGIIDLFQVPENKIKVIHEGVDERFQIIENSAIIKEAKQHYGIDKPFIFYVGVWRNHKNLEGLISAFEKLKKEHQIKHQLVLAGQEDLNYPNIRKKIMSSIYKQDIITPGFIEDTDLPILYNAAEVFVVPSFIEGFGLIGIEAQSCGVPIASTKAGSMPEVLGAGALYFDPNNTDQIAERISQILHDAELQKNLRNKGLVNVNRFSWQKCAEQTLQVYKNTLNQQKHG